MKRKIILITLLAIMLITKLSYAAQYDQSTPVATARSFVEALLRGDNKAIAALTKDVMPWYYLESNLLEYATDYLEDSWLTDFYYHKVDGNAIVLYNKKNTPSPQIDEYYCMDFVKANGQYYINELCLPKHVKGSSKYIWDERCKSVMQSSGACLMYAQMAGNENNASVIQGDTSEFELSGTIITRYIGNAKDVIIPEGITGIWDYAFAQQASLESVVMPESLEAIGEFAFYDCGSLSSVSFPEKLASLSQSAFYKCTSLESIALPEGIEVISSSLFNGCSSLEDVVIPPSVTRINGYAFSGCKALKKLTIPESVTYIESNAFDIGAVTFRVVAGSKAERFAVDYWFDYEYYVPEKRAIQVAVTPVPTWKEIHKDDQSTPLGTARLFIRALLDGDSKALHTLTKDIIPFYYFESDLLEHATDMMAESSENDFYYYDSEGKSIIIYDKKVTPSPDTNDFYCMDFVKANGKYYINELNLPGHLWTDMYIWEARCKASASGTGLPLFSAGNQGTSVAENVDGESPVINMIASSLGEMFFAGQTVTFSTIASDNVALSEIELYIDDELVCEEDTTGASGEISYTTEKLAVGAHRVCVVAVDTSGLRNTTDLTVTVQKKEPGQCDHINQTIIRTEEYQVIDGSQHKLIITDWTHCLDCDRGLSNVVQESEAENHQWEKGICSACKYVCQHDYVEDVSRTVPNSGVWKSLNSDKHIRAQIKYYEVCSICWDEKEGELKDDLFAEEKNHEFGEIIPSGYETSKQAFEHRIVGKQKCIAKGCNYERPAVGTWELHKNHTMHEKREYLDWGNRHEGYAYRTYTCICGKEMGGVSTVDLGLEEHVDADGNDVCDLCKGYTYLNNEFEMFNPVTLNGKGANSQYYGIDLFSQEKYSPVVKVAEQLGDQDWLELYKNTNRNNDITGYYSKILSEFLMDEAYEQMNNSLDYPEELGRGDDLDEEMMIDLYKERMHEHIATMLGQDSMQKGLKSATEDGFSEAEQEGGQIVLDWLIEKYTDTNLGIGFDDAKLLVKTVESVQQEYEENLERLEVYRAAIENSSDSEQKETLLKAMDQLELEYSAIVSNAKDWSIALTEKPLAIALDFITLGIPKVAGLFVSTEESSKYASIMADAYIEECIIEGGMAGFEETLKDDGHIKPGAYSEYINNAEYVYVSRISQCKEYGGYEKEINELKSGLEYVLKEKGMSKKEIKEYIDRVMD